MTCIYFQNNKITALYVSQKVLYMTNIGPFIQKALYNVSYSAIMILKHHIGLSSVCLYIWKFHWEQLLQHISKLVGTIMCIICHVRQ